KRAQAQATYGAYHDQLTGLYNRAGLRRFLAGLDSPASGTLAVVELDEYAAITTATEATAIHHLLMQLAASFRSLAATHHGEAARLGDGTFALWLPGLSMKRAGRATEQVTQGSFRVGKAMTGLTFATGLAETGNQTPDAALGNAEIAAQYARRRGRGQVTPYHDELRVQLAETFRLEQSLRDSVSSGQLKLHYQPTLHLGNNQISGAEALLRWERISTRLSPHELLELAARLRLLQPLSDWVMREAMQQQRAWNALWPELRVGINVSLEELRQPGALGALWPLLEQLQEQGSPLPNIEISASSMVDFRQQDAGVLRQLHGAGAALWLDHFGEGVMSLTSLTEFPLTGLKLHPQMISGLERGGRSPDLVAATLDMAGRLGLQVTAVGVETPGQLDTLRDLGCHQAQGYAISPPLTATALSDWLREHQPAALPQDAAAPSPDQA
ncbi:MAG: bifunctional diguanylate cyclase/phosphodiesterase, partial [Deinococcus sp.]|nr:bifunctional diguanylate cyclase/phosphodiesterase [Deinococcus sp.]